MMKTMIKGCVLSVLGALLLSGTAFGQRHTKSANDRPGSRGLYLQRQYLRLSQHNTAFVSFAHDHIERELTMEFADAARDASACASAVGVLFSIYDRLSCRADRDMAWPLIKAELASYVTRLDISAKSVDHNAATYAKSSAVATAAAQMKRDIDELKAFLYKTER